MVARRRFRILILALGLAALPVAPALAGRSSRAGHGLNGSLRGAPVQRFGVSPAERARFSHYVPRHMFPTRGYASKSAATNRRSDAQRLLPSDWHYIARHLPPHLFPVGGFTSAKADAGINWRDVAIGAAAAIALLLLALTGFLARRRRGGTLATR